ncbi:hypothetical protein ACK9YZ_23055 [Rhizobium sp. ZK1]|uniref:hypothetical protein n=1 Tax=Rhizobium sp. ZK1 TaxID=3389872 RepID=UPI0039F7019B
MNIMSSRPRDTAVAALAPADRIGRAEKIPTAGHDLLPSPQRGEPLGAADLRTIPMNASGDSDAEGFWSWKDAYEATEVAQVLFLRKFGAAIAARAKAAQATLSMLTKVASSAAEVWQSLLGATSVATLAGNMTLRRVRVVNDCRVELSGFTDGMRDRLRSLGLFSEMIVWKVRFLNAASDEGQAALSRRIERHRIVDVAGRG